MRTAGVGRSVEELQWDLDNLKTQWDADRRGRPRTALRRSSSTRKAMRSRARCATTSPMTSAKSWSTTAPPSRRRRSTCSASCRPRRSSRLKLYKDDVPLFTRFQIENQIESAYAHKVQLPSGGSIVIDYTEALVSIDINSARATRGSDIETTALNTNLEAADEIARQLRIRDLGGLIVIDFIDMESTQEPARGRGPAARCREGGPRAHPDRPPLALRPARDVAPAPAALARRVEPPGLPALQRASAASAASNPWRWRCCA